MAELHIDYEPPTTHEQLEWADDTSCEVAVSVPTAFEAEDGGACARFDVAATIDVSDRNACPHVRLEAVAYTHGGACKLYANGVDLLGTCGADRSAAYLAGGVCAASLDTTGITEPRTACFDTKVAGQGTDQLAAWVEALPVGTPMMLATCSRLAWAHNRANISSAFAAALGAGSAISDISDAYALVGVRGATDALAERRLPCCELAPGEIACATCAQNHTSAVADLACGAAATSLEDTLTVAFRRTERAAERAALRAAKLAMSPTESGSYESESYNYYSYGGGESEETTPPPPPPEETAAPTPRRYVGSFGSPSHVAALAALPQSTYAAKITPSPVVDASTALDAMQKADNDPLDAACEASGLVSGSPSHIYVQLQPASHTVPTRIAHGCTGGRRPFRLASRDRWDQCQLLAVCRAHRRAARRNALQHDARA